MTPRPLAAGVLFFAFLSLPHTAEAQGITPIQVARLQYVNAVWGLGDNGVLFTRVVPRLADDAPGGARAHLFVLKDGKELKLIGGKNSARSVSVVDGKVYLMAKREGDEEPQVYTLDPATGDYTRVTEVGQRMLSYKVSPDGKHIAFTALSPLAKDVARAREAGFKQKVVDEDYRHIDLWVFGRSDGKTRQLTRDKSVFSYEWAPNGEKLAAGLAPRNLVDDSYMFKRLHVVTLDGKVTPLVENPGKLGDYTWSPDSRHLAYISAVDRRDPHAGMLYLKSPENEKPLALTPGFKGMVHQVSWSRGKSVQVVISKGVHTYLATLEIPNRKLRIHAGGKGIDFHHAVFRGDHALVPGSNAGHPAEVFRVDLKDGSSKRLSHTNPWLGEVKLGRQEIVRFKARDGLEIEGLLMYPIDYEDGTRYPLVIVAHGGPESHFTEGWNTSYSNWGQLLCARNYFAWYPNYRASTGYGVEFAKADHGDVMGGEFRDHLDAIDHLDQKGLIDRARVGIGGGSYGGYTAAWAATKATKHFAAAVSFVPFVDIRTKWLTSDIPYEFYLVHYQEQWPHEQLGYLTDRSPLTHAQECRTPLLLLGGTSDPRVHPSQPFMLYRAVKFHTTTPVRYVQYPGEGHGNRVNTNRYDYMVRSLRWFDHYLAEGDRRSAKMPDYELDYSAWYATK